VATDSRPGFRATAVPWLKRAATIAIVVAIVVLVVREARRIEWPEVLEALQGYGFATLAIAFAITLPGQLACACFDLIGRHATGHKLPVPRVMLISFAGYYFSLNLGALVGGLAFRYRLYVPHGFAPMTISQIIGLSVLTNWSGYVLVAGVVLAYQPPDLPDDWGPGSAVLRGIGFALLAVAAAYIILCAVRGGMRVRWRGSELELPTLGVAAIQFALSIASWGTIGAVLTWLLPDEIGWFAVMPVLMISAIAGIWSHVPGGLGVTEFVFLTLLGHLVGETTLVAAVLAFRAVYYVLPFLTAIAVYAYLEATARRFRDRDPERR
jgi:hypothetical protein